MDTYYVYAKNDLGDECVIGPIVGTDWLITVIETFVMVHGMTATVSDMNEHPHLQVQSLDSWLAS